MTPVGFVDKARVSILPASLCAAAALAACALSWVYLSGLSRYLGGALALWLAYASYIDVRRYLLLDILTLPLALFGLGLAYLGLGPVLLDACLGAALGYGVFWLTSVLYFKIRGRHGLGLGDAKLMCAAGAWCGALALPFVVLIGSFAALAYVTLIAAFGRGVTADFKLPFGPFLSVGFFATWFLQASTLLFV